MKIPRNLLEKYNQPVPRYTSYPPANFFGELEEGDLPEKMLDDSNKDDPQNISIYIHVPFCNKICHYCGCNSMKILSEDKVGEYMNAVRKELKLFRNHINKDRLVSQIHWGGGTPNALDSGEIRRTMEQLNSDFDYIDHPEIAIECNPAGLTENYISDLHSAGFNRVSLGIQDFREDILNAVNREIPEIPVEKIVEWLRKKDDLRVNLDFIYGLPMQTVESFQATIKRAVAINPDRLVTFSYAHVPWVKPAQRVLEKYGLPDADAKLSLFENAKEQLEESGYRAIGLDHFARPDDELFLALSKRNLHRNFQGYCTRETTGQVYAAGISSISQLFRGYLQNTKSVKNYIENLESGKTPVDKVYRLTEEELAIREVINELMCNLVLDWDKISDKTGLSPAELQNLTNADENILRTFSEDGLLIKNKDNIEVTEVGKFFIRNIAAAFDPIIKNTDKKFSKSI